MIEFLLGAAAGAIVGYGVLRIMVHIALARAEREYDLGFSYNRIVHHKLA